MGRCSWPGGCSPPRPGRTPTRKFEWFIGSLIGQFLLLGYTWALIHHMLGGLRHLIWDTGRGFGPQEREWLARATIIGSLGLTLIVALVSYLFMGGSR